MQIYVKTWFVDCRSLIVECNKGQSERCVARGAKSQVTYIISRVTQGWAVLHASEQILIPI